MPDFHYRARNRQGRVTKGVMKAASEEQASAILSEHGLVPVEIIDARNLSVLRREFTVQHVRVRDRAIMARQLATMITAGIPVLQAVRVLATQTENVRLSGILREVSYDIEGGGALSDALEKYPQAFSEYFVSIVRSGEQAGRVAEALEQLADHEERDYELVSKVRRALVYPAFVVVTMTVIAAAMMVFVLPQLITLFEQSGVPLPLVTRVLIAVASFVASYWWFLLLFLFLASFLLYSYLRTPEGRYNAHAVLLRLPVFGKILRKLYLARFSGALQTLIGSEVPVVRSLLVARDALGNRIYQAIIEETAEEVKNGSTISASLEKYPEIPMMVSQMISVGERSGELGASLGAVHRFYRREVDEALDNLSQLVEPVIVVLLGIGVAVLLAAVLLPIYRLVQVIT